MTSEVRPQVFPVPSALVRKCPGVALDMGGSLVKVVYRSKQNLEEVQRNDGAKVGHLEVVCFQKAAINQALDYINEHAALSSEDDSGPVFSAGHGCVVYEKVIVESLGLSVQNVLEFDCLAAAFWYLASHQPRSALFHPYALDAGMAPQGYIKFLVPVFTHMGAPGPREGSMKVLNDPETSLGRVESESNLPVGEAEGDLFPCLLVYCGSGMSYKRINADGSLVLLDVASHGGLSFYGMGSLLTGCESFDELIELASRGDPSKVDLYTDDLFQSSDKMSEKNGYMIESICDHSEMVYCYGNCPGAKLDTFRREDVARSLLNNTTVVMADMVSLVANVAGLTRVVFCGGFFRLELVRSVMTTSMVKRNSTAFMLGKQPVKFDFIQCGPHLGSLGALIMSSGLGPRTTPQELGLEASLNLPSHQQNETQTE